MPINLLKMPSLIGEMVVTELDYQEIFLLSLCSRRSWSLVKKARITVPKLTFHSEKCDTFVIGVKTNMMRWSYVTSVKHVPKLNLGGVADVKPGIDYKATIVSWYEDDPDYDEEDPGSDEEDPGHGPSFRHRIECADEPMTIQKETQDHINSIFHYSGPYELYLSTKCKGQLPNIKNVEDIEIEHDTVDTEFLTSVLTKYPDTQSLSVVSNIIGGLPEDSPFFQVQNVYVASQCGPEYFQNFVGRNMFLEGVTVTEQDLIQLLQKWISDEAYHNLETLSIIVEHPLLINADLIRQAIEFEEYDPNEPEKRPKNFVMDAPFISNCAKEEYRLRSEDFVEIKRIADGKRAFLYCDPTQLDFLVPKV
ncbi:hypothetical protein B9Z55_016565 [Caenorhabditis nigoni]|nr:hypothetical protein B9Z55_016565 [Caenorhabditis nigoni]